MVSDNRISKVQKLVYEIRVGDVMTCKVVTVNPQTPMSQLRGILKVRKSLWDAIRRKQEDGRLRGPNG